MIFFLAGTSDARALAVALRDAGYPVLCSVVTDSAAESLRQAGLEARVGRLDPAGMQSLLQNIGARLLVDASHPFAEEAHRTAMAAAKAAGIPYVRYERAEKSFEGLQRITVVDTYEAAAEVAYERKGSVFLATGGKTLALFAKRLYGQPGIRMVVRLLPRIDNMAQCEALGISHRDIVAMLGPFSYELNQALFRHFGTTLMITKESGDAGAVDEKVQAAVDMGIDVVVIARPKLAYGTRFSTVEEILQEVRRQWQG
ncbi:precorrin-6A reductase [Alicyclobacillus sp.]|uniref:precorrin-6A reductase n=1 Tax=Alicyclobacillus sp. TaxID=61169 RepID=UPI0025BBB57F|nr:precorrin-6A reductase [Alicyclobacillus sp.]MCL6518069.1 precorrin-6A reductase [Alicyclobacillus sp.]